MEPGGVAALERRLRPGDVVVGLNGKPLEGVRLSEALRAAAAARAADTADTAPDDAASAASAAASPAAAIASPATTSATAAAAERGTHTLSVVRSYEQP